MSNHLKRLNAPRALHLHRKEYIWTVKGEPGPHPLTASIPLTLVVRDYLQLCDTGREAKRLIASGEIHVDGSPRKRRKFTCGFMDVISIPTLKKDFRVVFDQRGKLRLIPISSAEAAWKLCQIKNKTILKGGTIQLNLHDGRNLLVKEDTYHTYDVLKLSLKDTKIMDTYAFAKGHISMIVGGSHIGQTASIEDMEVIPSSKPDLAKMKDGDREFSTLQSYVFPIGKNKPAITLPEVRIQ